MSHKEEVRRVYFGNYRYAEGVQHSVRAWGPLGAIGWCLAAYQKYDSWIIGAVVAVVYCVYATWNVDDEIEKARIAYDSLAEREGE